MENKFKESLLDKNTLSVTWELVPEEEQLKRPRKLLLPPQNRQLRVEGSMHSPSLITRGVTQQFLRTIWVWKSSKWGLSRWFISPVKIRTVIRWKANCML